MVDYTRNAIDEKTPLVEKVLEVRYDPLRTADIALVARGNHKRWIIASAKMKKGDLISSYADIPKLPGLLFIICKINVHCIYYTKIKENILYVTAL